MSARSKSDRKSSRSRSSRHRGSRSDRERSKKEEDFTEQELFELAAASRDRQAIREFKAAVYCHGLTQNGVLRAKRRQDMYFATKAFVMYVQMICVMLVGFMAVIVFHRTHKGTESTYFATEIFIEVMVLFFLLLVIVFEHVVFRFGVPIVMLTMFFLNTIQIVFYLLFDSVAIECEKVDKLFGSIMCLLRHLPSNHMSVYVAFFLALLHFIGFIAGWVLIHYYPGTIIHLIELARQIGFTACVTFFEEAARARRKRRRRRRKSRKRGKKYKGTYAPDVDPRKLPVGTVVLAERTSAYKFKGNVQPRGMMIGSGQEIVNDTVTLQAPNKEQVKREIKVVRHVMVDGVREKVATKAEDKTTSSKENKPTSAKEASSKSAATSSKEVKSSTKDA